jgi:hypothetical protein
LSLLQMDRMAQLKEFSPGEFTEKEKERALAKIAHVASHYDLDRQGPLNSLSDGCG